MANIGEIAEIINASECTLHIPTGGANEYIMLQDLNIHISRPEFRDPTTSAGAVYTYGKGDHLMTFTLEATTPEIDSLSLLNNIGTDGDMPSTDFEINAKDVSGTTKTLLCTGVLSDLDIRKAAEGKVFLDCRVRITTDIVAVSS